MRAPLPLNTVLSPAETRVGDQALHQRAASSYTYQDGQLDQNTKFVQIQLLPTSSKKLDFDRLSRFFNNLGDFLEGWRDVGWVPTFDIKMFDMSEELVIITGFFRANSVVGSA